MARPKKFESSENMNVRVNLILKAKAQKMAEEAGMTLSDFVLECIRAKVDVPAYNPGLGRVEPARQAHASEPIQPKAVVAAAMSEAPFGKSATEFLEMGKPHDFGAQSKGSWPDAPEEVPTLESWSEVFARAKAQGDFGEEYFGEQVQAAGITRWPQGFRTWPVPKQVAWMDEKHPRKTK